MPVVLLHGALQTSDQFNSIIPYLEKHTSVISFNFIGHGGNTADFTENSLCNQLSEFINVELAECPYTIIGYSMGGYIALKASLNLLIKPSKIIIINSKLKWNDSILQSEIKKMNLNSMQEKVPAFITLLEKLHNPHAIDILFRNTIMLLQNITDNNHAFYANLATLPIETRLIRGALDSFVTPEECITMCSKNSKFSYTEIPNAKHPFDSFDPTVLSKYIIDELI